MKKVPHGPSARGTGDTLAASAGRDLPRGESEWIGRSGREQVPPCDPPMTRRDDRLLTIGAAGLQGAQALGWLLGRWLRHPRDEDEAQLSRERAIEPGLAGQPLSVALLRRAKNSTRAGSAPEPHANEGDPRKREGPGENSPGPSRLFPLSPRRGCP